MYEYIIYYIAKKVTARQFPPTISLRNSLLESFMFGFDTFSGWHFPWQPNEVGLTCIYFDAKTTELVNRQPNELVKSIINENALLYMPWNFKLLMLCSTQSLLYINKFESQNKKKTHTHANKKHVNSMSKVQSNM